MNRREFIAGAVASAGLAGCCSGGKCAGGAAAAQGRILLGAVRPLENAPLMKSIGYDFIETAVAFALIPDKGEEEWKAAKEKILNMPIPLRSCNGFLPGRFRLTGKDADWAPALAYAEKACRRADEVGVKTIVFGSSGARNVPANFLAGGKREWPEGFGIQKGRDQYAEFCRQLSQRIADCQVYVVIEPLCPDESNIINYVWQGMQIVNEINSPRLQQLADFYHMMCGREDAESVIRAGEHLKHCHIASDIRAFPGADPKTVYKLKPYMDALKEIGYTGGVSCECRWGDEKRIAQNLETALTTLKGLI